MENRKVAFRKVRGRIIPIKLTNQQRRDVAQGAAGVGAGVGVGVGAGAAYRSVVRRSSSMATKAWFRNEAIQKRYGNPAGDLFAYAKNQKRKADAQRIFDMQSRRAKNLAKLAPAFRIGGQLASSLLIGAGVAKIYSGLSDRQPSPESTAAVGSAASLTAFLTGSYRGAGFRQSTKGIYKKAYPLLRALKAKYKL